MNTAPHRRLSTRTLLTLTLLAAAAAPSAAQHLLWTRQLGTPAVEECFGVAVDGAGNAYISGSTEGSLAGPNTLYNDAFLAKHDASGALLWTRQLGTLANDKGSGVAVDSAGNAYLTGWTGGNLGGTNPFPGSEDAFLAKYNASGVLLWTRQLGTVPGDLSWGVAVDSAESAYIAGYTWGSLGGPNAGQYDAFLAKYNRSGALLWTRQLGTPGRDLVYCVAVDSAGSAYIAGNTEGSLGGPHAGLWDAFLAKYDASGALLWIRQLGTSTSDYGWGVAVDGTGNAYFGGGTEGSLGGPSVGSRDAILAKYNASGSLMWLRQTSTWASDVGYGVAVDSAGSAYLTGHTSANLAGPNAGSIDAFLAKYDASGVPLWTREIGTLREDHGYGVALDSAGHAYVAGSTGGSLGGPSAGASDAFLAKYGPPCYPNCDGSTVPPILNVSDFVCFLNRFAGGDAYANCDGSTIVPVLNVNDFICFTNRFATGCP